MLPYLCPSLCTPGDMQCWSWWAINFRVTKSEQHSVIKKQKSQLFTDVIDNILVNLVSRRLSSSLHHWQAHFITSKCVIQVLSHQWTSSIIAHLSDLSVIKLIPGFVLLGQDGGCVVSAAQSAHVIHHPIQFVRLFLRWRTRSATGEPFQSKPPATQSNFLLPASSARLALPHSGQIWRVTWCCSQSRISWGAESRSEGAPSSRIPKRRENDHRTPQTVFCRRTCKISPLNFLLACLTTHTCRLCFPFTFVAVHHVVAAERFGLENPLKASFLEKHKRSFTYLPSLQNLPSGSEIVPQ